MSLFLLLDEDKVDIYPNRENQSIKPEKSAFDKVLGLVGHLQRAVVRHDLIIVLRLAS